MGGRWANDGGKKYDGMEVDANDDEDMLKEVVGGRSGAVVFKRRML